MHASILSNERIDFRRATLWHGISQHNPTSSPEHKHSSTLSLPLTLSITLSHCSRSPPKPINPPPTLPMRSPLSSDSMAGRHFFRNQTIISLRSPNSSPNRKRSPLIAPFIYSSLQSTLKSLLQSSLIFFTYLSYFKPLPILLRIIPSIPHLFITITQITALLHHHKFSLISPPNSLREHSPIPLHLRHSLICFLYQRVLLSPPPSYSSANITAQNPISPLRPTIPPSSLSPTHALSSLNLDQLISLFSLLLSDGSHQFTLVNTSPHPLPSLPMETSSISSLRSLLSSLTPTKLISNHTDLTLSLWVSQLLPRSYSSVHLKTSRGYVLSIYSTYRGVSVTPSTSSLPPRTKRQLIQSLPPTNPQSQSRNPTPSPSRASIIKLLSDISSLFHSATRTPSCSRPLPPQVGTFPLPSPPKRPTDPSLHRASPPDRNSPHQLPS
uniref:Uncharacterized protein n=1 Tax=Knipowitschia caucasica TaxID=637954 RepID=A0AAV2KP84_KNICA